MITLFQVNVPDPALRAVEDVLRKGFLSEGRQVRHFEEEFSTRFNLPRGIAVNSGTAALHLALLAGGLKPHDEVIVPAQTFVATAMTVMMVGARPVFADIHPRRPTLDPSDVAKRVTDRTKAIIVVHYGGDPCDMDEIRDIANRNRLFVVEDAAHALGAVYRGRPIGSLGDFAAFSFQAIKQLTTGDGGMLLARDPTAWRTAYRLRWFGIDRELRRPSELGEAEWPIHEVGFKYHMNDIAAALGLASLDHFAHSQSRRVLLDNTYRTRLAAVPGVQLLDRPRDRVSACWLFTVLVQNRLAFVRALKSRGVEAAVWHQRIDRHPVFGGMRSDLPRQDHFNEHQVSLPMRASLADDEAESVLSAVEAGW